MAIKTVLFINENGQDVPVYPQTTAEQVLLLSGQTVEEAFAEDAVAVFESALNGSNQAAGNP